MLRWAVKLGVHAVAKAARIGAMHVTHTHLSDSKAAGDLAHAEDTLRYAAPEAMQAAHEGAARITASAVTDIRCIQVIAGRLLTGKRVFATLCWRNERMSYPELCHTLSLGGWPLHMAEMKRRETSPGLA